MDVVVPGAGATFTGVAIAQGNYGATPVFGMLKFAIDSQRRLLGSVDRPSKDSNLNSNYRVSWR